MTTLGIEGGRVLVPDGTVRRADVLVDREAGEVLRVERGAAGDADERLDADGGVVIPGLVNAHTHAAMTLLRGYADDKPLERWLREDVWPVEAELTPEDVRAGTDLALVEMIRNGVTAFADMYFEMDRVVAAVEAAGVRARLGYGVVTVGKDEEESRREVERTAAFAREYDGAADGRIRTAVMPHSLTTVAPEFLEDCVERAREIGVPVHYHANETTDEVEPIVEEHDTRPLELADDLGMLEAEDFLAHGVHVDDREVELLADRGTGVIHCPASNMKLASGLAPVRAMCEAGVTVGIGTDGAGSNNDLDVFDELRDAAMVGKVQTGDASALPAATVVEMATAGSADAVGLPGGRIDEGEAADLAVVDLEAPHLTPVHDPVSHLAYAARGSDVRHTVCDGEVLMEDHTVRTVDEGAVRRRAREHASDLIDRVEG
jgi:5-methylthioadenosine/S-adenosylhomocysteine deaminase